MEEILKIISELRNIASGIEKEKREKIIQANEILKYILSGDNYYPYSVSLELGRIEDKFNIYFSDELKELLTIVGLKGFYFSGAFDLNNSNYRVEACYSRKFVKILIDLGIDKALIEDSYYELEDDFFSSDLIKEVYNEFKDEEDLLIYYISFSECCGGRSLFIVNGIDKDIIAFDNHVSYKKLTIENETYFYMSYLTDDCRNISEHIYEEIQKTKDLLLLGGEL
jgi:hypothetical protein